MLEVASEKLTERERECMKHLRQAREGGVSFAQYCRTNGLKSSQWHSVRHGMVAKGLVPPGQGGKVKKKPSRRKPAGFIPVRMDSSQVTVTSTAVACRVRHPSGYVIECVNWPDPSWMKGLLERRS
jgi:hypothetical protein